MSKKGYKFCIAFSDPDAGEIGTVYQATNWMYLGTKKDIHWDMYNVDGTLHLNDRDVYKKLGFRGKAKQLEYIKDKPHLKLCERKPKARYIKLLGDRRDKRRMSETLTCLVKPYPKRSEDG